MVAKIQEVMLKRIRAKIKEFSRLCGDLRGIFGGNSSCYSLDTPSLTLITILRYMYEMKSAYTAGNIFTASQQNISLGQSIILFES